MIITEILLLAPYSSTMSFFSVNVIFSQVFDLRVRGLSNRIFCSLSCKESAENLRNLPAHPKFKQMPTNLTTSALTTQGNYYYHSHIALELRAKIEEKTVAKHKNNHERNRSH